MNSATTRQRTVEALREHSGLTAYSAEHYILVSAAAIIRECTMDDLLMIAATTAETGDLWGARAMADFEIARRESNAGTRRDSKGGTL